MDETNVIVDTEQVTTPAPEDENNVVTVNTETAAGTAAEETDTTDTPAEEEASTAAQVTTPDEQTAADTETQAIIIPVKYKGEDMNLTIDEAAQQVQRGMMYHEKLHRLASDCGKDVDTFINDLYKASEDATYNRLLEEAGGNESVAKRLLELEQQKQNAAYKKAQEDEKAAKIAEKNTLNERLASDFIELKAEYPDYVSFADVPKSVVKLAIDKNISLYDAHLRYERAEGKKIETAKQQQATASAASVGSQANTSAIGEADPIIAAMMEGISAAL